MQTFDVHTSSMQTQLDRPVCLWGLNRWVLTLPFILTFNPMFSAGLRSFLMLSKSLCGLGVFALLRPVDATPVTPSYDYRRPPPSCRRQQPHHPSMTSTPSATATHMTMTTDPPPQHVNFDDPTTPARQRKRFHNPSATKLVATTMSIMEPAACNDGRPAHLVANGTTMNLGSQRNDDAALGDNDHRGTCMTTENSSDDNHLG